MPEIPCAVLSEHFQERMAGRRLLSAVFLTYQFDPGFFEQEILPVFLDVPLSHAVAIRLVQMEDALRSGPEQIAVYYDANGLVNSDSGSAKLDIRRIPVRHRTGAFHPKNIFLLVEPAQSDQNGEFPQSLVIASLSANLTRSGWWENVEACHVEEIADGEKTRLKDDLVQFLSTIRSKVPAGSDGGAIRGILRFLRKTEQRLQRSSEGMLHPHFFFKQASFVDYLDRTAGDSLNGAYLEVISPYFDDAAECAPLSRIINRFQPKEVRISIPLSSDGECQCREDLYQSAGKLPGVSWGRLPKDLLLSGRSDDAKMRFVHAKVYRFFTQNPKREYYFIGSANLTNAAQLLGGNVESGFFLDIIPERRPDFWLTVVSRQTNLTFKPSVGEEMSNASRGTPLNLCFHWDREEVTAFWDHTSGSFEIRLQARGIQIGVIQPLPPRLRTILNADIARRIRSVLIETSLIEVCIKDDPPAPLLIQEEGMFKKPSLLLNLSAEDIFRYWSLLTPEQRAAFVENHASELALTGQGADLVARVKLTVQQDTLFDRFAGCFHAFGCLERSIRAAIEARQYREADYRLFGMKYDSLGKLLDQVSSANSHKDEVDQLVIFFCAKQLCKEIERDYPDYWHARTTEVEKLNTKLEGLTTIRNSLIDRYPGNLADFLDWFERWFMERAIPIEAEDDDR